MLASNYLLGCVEKAAKNYWCEVDLKWHSRFRYIESESVFWSGFTHYRFHELFDQKYFVCIENIIYVGFFIYLQPWNVFSKIPFNLQDKHPWSVLMQGFQTNTSWWQAIYSWEIMVTLELLLFTYVHAICEALVAYRFD